MRFPKSVELSFLAIVYASLMTTMVEATYDRIHYFYYGNSGFAMEAVYRIPGTYEEIVLERRAAHLFLAEYDRELVFRIGDREFARETAGGDSGGYCQMKIFKISPTRYLLCGELSSDAHIVDAGRRTIRNARDEDRFPHAIYIGMFDSDKNEPWRFISSNQRPESTNELGVSGCSSHIGDVHGNLVELRR